MLHWAKDEVRALVVCALLLLVGVVFVFIYQVYSDRIPRQVPVNTEEDLKVMVRLEESLRTDSLRNARKYASNRKTKLFPFDPNRADSATLLSLGLTRWQVANMLKYRRKGGRWRSAGDFSRLYGLSSHDFERLRPYVKIAPEDQRAAYDYSTYRQREYRKQPDSLRIHSVPKLSEGEMLELSTADTVALKKIPGIGSYYAGKIVRYRERLGGFVSLNQLAEIEGLPAGISRWFTLNQHAPLRQMSLNHSTFKQLVRHPYLSYEQTKVIVNHIRKYGPITDWNDLRLYKEFTDDDFERLRQYFSFD